MEFHFQDISWLKHVMLLYILLSIRPSLIRSLDCYQCSNIKNISDCHHTDVCADNEFCFTDTVGYGDQTRFNMGCRDQSACAAQTTTTTTISPMSIIGRETTQDLECSQCCGVDACNKHLCTTGTHAANQDGNCRDDPDFNCAKISSVFNVCSNREHAKLVCREFCGLCAAVDGGWSAWSGMSNCDTTCGNGTMSRSRLCNGPKPQYGGLPCIGSNIDKQGCYQRPCPVDGVWNGWSDWQRCSTSCGIGIQARTRGCSNPSPRFGGLQCPGDATDTKACFLRPCSDGAWSAWSPWSTCSQSCLGGFSKRHRQCNNPAPSTFGHDCNGNNEEYKICNSVPCHGQAINGGWTSWSHWSTCPVSCGGGLETRTRSCTNPSPANFGQSCIGNSEDKKICNTNDCPVSTLVRLVGPSKSQGRLEVFYNEGWGTVCDKGFSNVDAAVVCRMMNLPSSEAIAVPSAYYGQGSLPIKFDEVGCLSTHTSLFQCSLDVNATDCTHGRDVSVVCDPHLHVRLQGGHHQGRLEVSLDGRKWGTVCDDSFSDNSATVVCKMLGYHSWSFFSGTVSKAYGPGSGDILLDDVVCSGSENSLLQCQHNTFTVNNCQHKEDVGVICL